MLQAMAVVRNPVTATPQGFKADSRQSSPAAPVPRLGRGTIKKEATEREMLAGFPVLRRKCGIRRRSRSCSLGTKFVARRNPVKPSAVKPRSLHKAARCRALRCRTPAKTERRGDPARHRTLCVATSAPARVASSASRHARSRTEQNDGDVCPFCPKECKRTSSIQAPRRAAPRENPGLSGETGTVESKEPAVRLAESQKTAAEF